MGEDWPEDVPRWREQPIPDAADGMRLDRFLARRFADRSRSELARGIRAGLVQDEDGRPLRASSTVRAGTALRILIPGIAPTEPPPPFPPVLYEDDRVIALDKPAGMICHPAGTHYTWAAISLAKRRWPHDRVDLVHRIDRDTSGILLLTKDLDANRFLKAALVEGRARKEYVALAKGRVRWTRRTVDAPIGPAGGAVRIQQAIRPDGLSARTHVVVEDTRDRPGPGLTQVRCRIETGRQHQIRVHMASLGLPLLGDLLYGVPQDVFLGIQEQGHDPSTYLHLTGAPRHALHAAFVEVPHPDGSTLAVECPWPADLRAWWDHPDSLPWSPPNDEEGAAVPHPPPPKTR